MSYKVGFILEACATALTFVGFDSRVHVHVAFVNVLCSKSFPTLTTIILECAGVLAVQMPLKILISRKPLSTKATRIVLLPGMNHINVSLESQSTSKLAPTTITKQCTLVMEFEHVRLVNIGGKHLIANGTFSLLDLSIFHFFLVFVAF